MKDIKSAKKIVIVGDAGRGKTTFSNNLSKKLGLTVYSTDDFFWKKKYTERYSNEESVKEITENVYKGKDQWIVEGTTTRLVAPGLELADIIINLKFKNIFSQYIVLTKRCISRDDENLKTLIPFLMWVTKVRFSKDKRHTAKKKILEAYPEKTIILESYREIDEFVDSL